MGSALLSSSSLWSCLNANDGLDGFAATDTRLVFIVSSHAFVHRVCVVFLMSICIGRYT